GIRDKGQLWMFEHIRRAGPCWRCDATGCIRGPDDPAAALKLHQEPTQPDVIQVRRSFRRYSPENAVFMLEDAPRRIAEGRWMICGIQHQASRLSDSDFPSLGGSLRWPIPRAAFSLCQ